MEFGKSKHITNKLHLIKSMIGESQQDTFEELLLELIGEVKRPTIENIWIDDDSIISYWIVLINGINNNDEIELVKKILFWKEFFSETTAKIRCLQSSNHKLFNLCLKEFKIDSSPAIICSNTPGFEDRIIVDTTMLNKIIKEEYGIQTLLNKIHHKLVLGNEVITIQNEIGSLKFWRVFERVSELKEMISKDEIEKVVAILLRSQDVKRNQSLENEIISISSSIRNSASNYRKGILPEKDYILNRNNAINKLLLFIDEIQIQKNVR